MKRIACLFTLFLFAVGMAESENWPQFRGPTGQGLSGETGVPVQWSATDNVAWKTSLPGDAFSSPIVWGDHVFVTTATDNGESCRVIALERTTGRVLWNREVFRQVPRRKQDRNTYATPTPAADGERVYACFFDGSFAALDFSGEIIWTNRGYPFYSEHGLGSSPMLYRDLLIMARDGSGQGEEQELGWQKPWDQAFIVALDTRTGQERWKARRGWSRISHGVPVLWEHEGKVELVSEAGDVVQGFDLETGERLWSSEVLGEGKVPSTVVGEGLVFTAGGWGGRETIKAFKLGGRGDLKTSNLVWEQRKGMPKVPSMLYVKPHLFATTDGGIATCLKAATGEMVWQERLGGNFSASPVAADGRIYFVSDEGDTTVIEAGPTFRILARNPLGEKVQASPAISQGQIFIRTERTLFCLGAIEPKPSVESPKPLPRLRVSDNQRHLVTDTGEPFFWLGDTAWELFHRLNREEATRYLEDRARKGFTVIQAVALAELDGLNTPNAYGHRPLLELDPTRPDVKEGAENDYWDHVDFVVTKAESLGLYVGFLPTWGDKWHKNGGTGPLVFTPENAEVYGRFLGQRYRNHPLVWILGGDKFVGDEEERRILEAMARGLKQGDGGAHLITFHPIGQFSSAIWFHDAPWLDFNMVQTGHTLDRDNYTSIAAEYQRTPLKPVLDGEPGYENIPHAFNAANPRLEAIHARRFCYWALFSGAFGHTYGCNEVWQMWAPDRKPLIGAQLPWNEAIDLPGAGQMRHARALIESGPYFDRMPDPSLVAPPNGGGTDYVAACRAPDARYALVYFPTGQPATLRTFLLQGPRLTAQWFDPRTGEREKLPMVEAAPWKTTTFEPPKVDLDWVLILEVEP